MFSEINNDALLKIMEREKFICFFNFKIYGADGEVALDGLCKLAQSSDPELANYFSLVMIFDTPDQLKSDIAHRIPKKLHIDDFKRANQEISAITSLPATVIDRPDHYIHTIDIVFPNGKIQNPSDIANAIVYTLRHSADFETEQPVFWEDAPPPSEIEKAGYIQRIKAFFGL